MEERFDSYADLRDGVVRVIRLSKSRLDIFDPSFVDLGLGAGQAVEAMTELLRQPDSRVRLVAHDVSYLETRCPRLMLLLRSYSHKIAIHRTLESAKSVQDSIVLGDEGFMLRRYHKDYARGSISLDEIPQCAPWRERFDAIWDASEAAVSFTTLGL